VVVNDLKDFQVLETWIDGKMIAKDGKALFSGGSRPFPPTIHAPEVTGNDLTLKAPGPRARVRVIEARENEVTSGRSEADLDVIDGTIVADIEGDVLHLVVISRYGPAPPAMAFIHGFGLKEGALASSVSHDAHNIIAVGEDPDLLARAINSIIHLGGGMYAGTREKEATLPLLVAGLMSGLPADEVVRMEDEINALAHELGCPMSRPFMTLSYQSLLAVPALKLGDRGLIDTLRRQPVPSVVQ
jgi:adenine deaminase